MDAGGGDAGTDGGGAETGPDMDAAMTSDAAMMDEGTTDAAMVDAGNPDAGCETPCYPDSDNDGFAAAGAVAVLACACSTGTTSVAPSSLETTDCNDSSMSIGPAGNTNAARCGRCDQACASDPNGGPLCAGGVCSLDCDGGYHLDAGACAPINPPRQTAPLSTATTTSRRPFFRWQLSGVADGARVQLCATRACTTVTTQFDATGSSARPATDLAPGLHYWRLVGRAGSDLGTATSPVWQVRIPARSAPSVNVSWGHEPDFNGDGLADIVVGAQAAASNVGRAHIYYGSATGPASSPDRTLQSPGGANGNFGTRVVSAGDVDGDGFADLAVYAPGAFGGGRVYWYRGSASGISATPDGSLEPMVAGGYIGYGLAAGDVNGDGYSDIVTGGTPPGSTNGGLLHVYFGGPSGPAAAPSVTRTSPAGNESFGYFVDVGDFDGDGFADVLASAHFHATYGAVYMYRGNATGLASSPSTTMTSPDTSGALGQGGVAAVGDLNGDGRGDAVTSTYGSANDRVHVYYGGGAGLTSAPSLSISSPGGCCFGSVIPTASTRGDVNGDGYSDLVLGNFAYPASGADRQGRAYVFYGGSTGVAGTPQVDLPNPDGTNAYFGLTTSAADVDGDGFADVLVGSFVSDLSGRVHVHRGSSLGLSTTRSWLLSGPDGAGAYYGISIAFWLGPQSLWFVRG